MSLILVFSMLTIGIEGSADMANDGHSLDETGSHHSEVMHDATPDGNPDSEPDNEQCEHCCHGHTVGLAIRALTTSAIPAHPVIGIRLDQGPINRSQAPPTPPPKATV